MRSALALLAVVAGCGRIGFDARSGGDGGTGDATDGQGIDGTFVGAKATYVKALNTDADDFFGTDVAVSADGNTVVTSAYGEDGGAQTVNGDPTNDSEADAGAAYVLVREAGVWSYQAYLKASNGESTDNFGSAVAISGDGDTIAVTATGEDSGTGGPTDDSQTSAGAAYVFRRVGGVWSAEAMIKAPNVEMLDEFGFSVALSGDGNLLAVGAPSEDSAIAGVDVAGAQADNGKLQSGAVYVFVRSGGNWSFQNYIKASNPDPADLFGTAVALASDGSTLAVGAPQESSTAAGVGGNQLSNGLGNSGAAYVFDRAGATWTQQVYIKASNPTGGAHFGGALSLSATGDTLVAGAVGESGPATGIGGVQANTGAFASGAAYIFERVGTSWSQSTYVKATNTDANDRFGFAVSLSPDSQFLVVGAQDEQSASETTPGDNSLASAGAVYLYARAGGTWTPRAYLKLGTPASGDNAGNAVAVAAEASVVVIGATGENGSGVGVGATPNASSSNTGVVQLIE